MSIVKINAISVPADKQERFEERFQGRAGAVEKTPGFEWFELLRPLEGTDQYLVYTRWRARRPTRRGSPARTSTAPTRAAATPSRRRPRTRTTSGPTRCIESAGPNRPERTRARAGPLTG